MTCERVCGRRRALPAAYNRIAHTRTETRPRIVGSHVGIRSVMHLKQLPVPVRARRWGGQSASETRHECPTSVARRGREKRITKNGNHERKPATRTAARGREGYCTRDHTVRMIGSPSTLRRGQPVAPRGCGVTYCTVYSRMRFTSDR